MNEKHLVKTSKFLSLVLRHDPGRIGIELDNAGWVDVEELLGACKRHGTEIDKSLLERVVAESEKKRLAFSEDGRRIRANQGHSVEVELGYTPQTPPAKLYHGTASRFLSSILATGLNKGERHHVHLSYDEGTAYQVGQRHGKPVVLIVDTGAMHSSGHPFFLSQNGVWLTDHVPVEFIQIQGTAGAANSAVDFQPK